MSEKSERKDEQAVAARYGFKVDFDSGVVSGIKSGKRLFTLDSGGFYCGHEFYSDLHDRFEAIDAYNREREAV